MRTVDDLRDILRRIDHRGYKAYKDLEGSYRFDLFFLYIDHVQGDPFASPSRLRVQVPQRVSLMQEEWMETRSRLIALEDFLTRRFSEAIKKISEGRRGTGKSGLIEIDAPGQEILPRSSAFVTPDHVEARFAMGLPARGMSVLGKQAEEMLCRELPEIVRRSLIAQNLDSAQVLKHVQTAEDADLIRDQLDELGLVAFIADGSVLPRESGISDRPMSRNKAIPFVSPQSLRVEISTRNRGAVTGMGVRKGVTLIVGGGYHGKSTLLRAIERGVYNHIPGDGREFVVTNSDAAKIRAEDGRRVEQVDISPFISNLPFPRDTSSFSTEEASGSTSQAANIMEALEMGSSVLLIDEDTSATNFMIRDIRMQKLVSKDKEPITPFVDRVRAMYKDYGVSTILVIGGSGDYLDVADTVIMMDEYAPVDVTEKAYRIAQETPTGRKSEGGIDFGEIRHRAPVNSSVNAVRGRRVKVAARGLHSIQFGHERIDLRHLEQLVSESQSRAIADALLYARKYMDGRTSLRSVIEALMRDIDEHGIDVISPLPGQLLGSYALPRRHEIAGSLNRLRSLRVNPVGTQSTAVAQNKDKNARST